MNQTSISITSLDGKTRVTDNITYVNPEATDAQLMQFARMLIGMTSRELIAVTKITKEVVVNE